MRYPTATSAGASRKGIALIAVLVVVAVLALAAYRFSDLMESEAVAGDSYSQKLRAKGGADSGIAYMAAALANDPTGQNSIGNLFDNSSFQHYLVHDSNETKQRVRFSLVSPLDPDTLAGGSGGSGSFRYGLIDEAGKININALFKLDSSGTLLYNTLMQLPNMTDDIANSIIYWIDPNAAQRSSGATDEYYGSLSPSYHAKNAPLDSLEEMLYIRGVTPELLYGNDRNRNGILDPDEDDGTGTLNLGWAAYLTVYSREQNVSSNGTPRIYVNDPDLQSLQNYLTAGGFDDTITSFIIAARMYGLTASSSSGGGGSGSGSGAGGTGAGSSGNKPANTGPSNTGQGNSMNRPSGGTVVNSTTTASGVTTQTVQAGAGQRIQRTTLGTLNSGSGGNGQTISSLFSLVNAKVTIPASTPGGQSTTYPSPMSDANGIQQYLPQVLDLLTTKKTSNLPGRININTAPSAVLSALSDTSGNPLIDPATVQTILSTRPPLTGMTTPPDPIFQTPAWLITQANLSPTLLQQLDQYITAHSQVYRVQSLGYLDGGGPTARVEAVIDINAGRPRIVYYRDLTSLGKGFNLQSGQ
jgi:type II secretory pathway component PulK